MRKLVYFCDHCGKEINKEDLQVVLVGKIADLCPECFKEFEALKRFISKEKEDNT